jgi:hypothetical protein
MRIRFKYLKITPLLVAGAAAAAIAAAPTASSQPACVTAAGAVQCQTPTSGGYTTGGCTTPYGTYQNCAEQRR